MKDEKRGDREGAMARRRTRREGGRGSFFCLRVPLGAIATSRFLDPPIPWAVPVLQQLFFHRLELVQCFLEFRLGLVVGGGEGFGFDGDRLIDAAFGGVDVGEGVGDVGVVLG